MGTLVSDALLRSVEQGILGLLLALGAACLIVFTWRWRAVRLSIAGTMQWRKRLERGAQFLGTVGANAPFLGLTGTVLGILAAFRRMAEQGGSGGVEVMAAIAGALIATAAGLLVAIPAVVLYNLLKTTICDTLDALAEIRGLLLARSLQAAARETF